jgi:hypothetical protein
VPASKDADETHQTFPHTKNQGEGRSHCSQPFPWRLVFAFDLGDWAAHTGWRPFKEKNPPRVALNNGE